MPDYYQAVVVDYLRADRSLFVNTECCIQINQGENPDTSGPHWYCDAVAADFRSKTVYLCEISYSETLQALIKRIRDWSGNWNGICSALVRDNNLPQDWHVRPWFFVPEANDGTKRLIKALKEIEGERKLVFSPKVTTLEMVQPWNYCSWNRKGEHPKPELIPDEMKA